MGYGCIFSRVTLIGMISISEDGDGNLTGVYLPNSNLPEMDVSESEVIAEAFGQMDEYLSGKRKEFDLPLDYGVTGFRRSVLEEINAVRLERAFALLRRPNYPISLVAGECGWQTDAYLKRLFKRTTGLTMREWRRRESGASRSVSGSSTRSSPSKSPMNQGRRGGVGP